MADAGQRDLKGVQRAGADVAVDDAERGERQEPGIAGVSDMATANMAGRTSRPLRQAGAGDQWGAGGHRCTRGHIHRRPCGRPWLQSPDISFKIQAIGRVDEAGQAAAEPHSFLLAIAAPSASARNFAQTMLSTTIGSVRTAVPKPQSTPAISRSRSITPA